MNKNDPLAEAIVRQNGNRLSVRVGDDTFILKSWTLREGRLDTEWELASIVPQRILDENAARARSLLEQVMDERMSAESPNVDKPLIKVVAKRTEWQDEVTAMLGRIVDALTLKQSFVNNFNVGKVEASSLEEFVDRQRWRQQYPPMLGGRL